MTKAKQLGFWMALALVVGNMIGSGVFLLPAALAPYGLSSVPGWILTAIGSLLLAVVFSVLSRAHPQVDGPYAYTRLAFGDLVGFVAAWGYWVAVWVGNAAVASGLVSYLASLIPGIAEASVATMLVIVWFLTWLNLRGARKAGALQIVTTILKLLPLLLVAGLGLYLAAAGDPRLDVGSLTEQPMSWSAITASATITLWAFLGLECAAVASEKVENPQRNVALATLWGTLIAALVYVLSCTTVLLLLPSEQLAQSNAPYADAIDLIWGASSGRWLALFAAISGFGALAGWILVQGELPYQMAKAGVFPRFFARVNKRGAPVAGLLVSGILLSLVILTNAGKSLIDIYTFLLLISTAATLVMYLLCALAAVVLHMRGQLPLPRHRLLIMTIALLAVLYALWALYGAGHEALLWGLALLLLAVPIYHGKRYLDRQPI